MFTAVLILVCLACKFYGRRVQTWTKQLQQSAFVEQRKALIVDHASSSSGLQTEAGPDTKNNPERSRHVSASLGMSNPVGAFMHSSPELRLVATRQPKRLAYRCLLMATREEVQPAVQPQRVSTPADKQLDCGSEAVLKEMQLEARTHEPSRSHKDRIDAVMALESEFLFSGTRAPSSAHYPCALGLVRATLEEKLHPEQASSDVALDSASPQFEAMLTRLRAAAGFANATPWREASEMPWASEMRKITPILQTELAAALNGTLGWDSADYQAIAPDWRVIHLWQRGDWLADAERIFPETLAALKTLLTANGLRFNPMQNVACGIARLPAGSVIAPHCDGNVLGLTCHLGVVVPPTGCSICVGGQAREWAEGEMLLFDTTFKHSVENKSPGDRYVLMINVLRPGVNDLESAALVRHLSAPTFRLDSINPFYLWLPAAAEEGHDEEPASDSKGITLRTAKAGDVFVAASAAAEVAPGKQAIEVSPSCWLPLRRGADEAQRAGLSLVMPLSERTFTTLSQVDVRTLPTFDAPSVDGEHFAEGLQVTPSLALTDDKGFLTWLGFWHSEAASLMRPASSAVVGDEFDVPMAVLQQHIRLLREPLNRNAKWVPMVDAKGTALLSEAPSEKPVQAGQGLGLGERKTSRKSSKRTGKSKRKKRR
mmetsp:Transcript_120656/g.232851  ORF Transcript_120656/g.232851 Transcript_120656/m.232851 type:complete len:657 (+) Transcript_120656:69-2039(+)